MCVYLIPQRHITSGEHDSNACCPFCSFSVNKRTMVSSTINPALHKLLLIPESYKPEMLEQRGALERRCCCICIFREMYTKDFSISMLRSSVELECLNSGCLCLIIWLGFSQDTIYCSNWGIYPQWVLNSYMNTESKNKNGLGILYSKFLAYLLPMGSVVKF